MPNESASVCYRLCVLWNRWTNTYLKTISSLLMLFAFYMKESITHWKYDLRCIFGCEWLCVNGLLIQSCVDYSICNIISSLIWTNFTRQNKLATHALTCNNPQICPLFTSNNQMWNMTLPFLICVYAVLLNCFWEMGPCFTTMTIWNLTSMKNLQSMFV